MINTLISLRSLLWLGFFATILIAWWVMYSMATNMGLDLIGRSVGMSGEMSMSEGSDTMSSTEMAQSQDATSEETGSTEMTQEMASGEGMAMDNMAMDGMMDMGSFGPLFAMWAIMMAAMMLPTMVPTLRAYEDLMKSANGTWAGWFGVLLGYFVMWVGFAALIAAVQLGLLFSGLINMMGIPSTTVFAAILLIIVGAFQFTRVKEICHGVCHSPMSYFLGHWRNGFAGGLRMGLGLGAFCVGCCWGFMALGFVGGVMNLLWMGLATLFMVIEKLPQIGHVVRKPAGAVLILGGLGLLLYPYVSGG